jgi:hypothetical protein
MKSSVSYKNCLIRSESFQLAQSSSWIPRYTLTRQDAANKWNGTLSHHDRLDKCFGRKTQPTNSPCRTRFGGSIETQVQNDAREMAG